MTLIESKYKRLSAQSSILQDQVVLAQAWKKTHAYVRAHNWYADVLELDVSAACLDTSIVSWSKSIASANYTTSPARLVPAPKNGLWKFNQKGSGDWGPVIRDVDDAPVLRPLAHIGIKEQTVATATMLCLAECIESAQGDTSLPALEARSQGVYSYGNRLFCSWVNGPFNARFAWGNSNTYSRYFQDYQRFIDRPVTTAAQAQLDGYEDVFIVSLDIAAFFDNIDIASLVDKMRAEYISFVAKDSEVKGSDKLFWRTVYKALSFRWSAKDEKLRKLFRGEILPFGLPQGLAASGFFSNAYLLSFDRAIGRSLNKNSNSRSFKVLDYCRYVDDLRIVVAVAEDGGSDCDEVALGGEVERWAQGLLKKETGSVGDNKSFLKINSGKTQVERIGGVGSEARTASQMKALQQKISGPFDLDSLQQVETGLNGLLSLAELSLMEDDSVLKPPSLKLASVSRTKLELRDDTLTRFSAYRLVRSLRMRRSMTDLSGNAIDGRDPARALADDFQATAHRLVSAWAVNPSLVQVLRYALDLYPSPELLEPVAEALLSKIKRGSSVSRYERYVAYYVLSQLFRAGATETGKTESADKTFSVGGVEEYRDMLGDLAFKVLGGANVPWFVQQQGILLLAALGRTSDLNLSGTELDRHRALQAFIKASPDAQALSVGEEVVVSIVGHQMMGDVSHYMKWFKALCRGRSRTYISSAWKIIGEVAPDLFISLVSAQSGRSGHLASFAPKYLSRYLAARWGGGLTPLPTSKWIPLATVISHPSRPFSQENALLKLAMELLTESSVVDADAEKLTPINVEIRSDNWKLLDDPRSESIQVRYIVAVKSLDKNYTTPAWCPAKDAWMYALGRLLRSAATGEADFTTRHWLMREDAHWYLGLRSTWQKRRTGMLHTAEALRGTTAAITP